MLKDFNGDGGVDPDVSILASRKCIAVGPSPSRIY